MGCLSLQLSCPQLCSGRRFGVSSLGAEDWAWLNCPRRTRTMPGAAAQPSGGVEATFSLKTSWKRLVKLQDGQRGVLGRELLASPSSQLQGREPTGAGDVDVIGLTWGPPTHVPGPTADTWEMTVISHSHRAWSTSLLLSEVLWPVTCCLQPWEGFAGSFRKVSIFWYCSPRPVAVFLEYFVV